jgi:hypothetical protein
MTGDKSSLLLLMCCCLSNNALTVVLAPRPIKAAQRIAYPQIWRSPFVHSVRFLFFWLASPTPSLLRLRFFHLSFHRFRTFLKYWCVLQKVCKRDELMTDRGHTLENSESYQLQMTTPERPTFTGPRRPNTHGRFHMILVISQQPYQPPQKLMNHCRYQQKYGEETTNNLRTMGTPPWL